MNYFHSENKKRLRMCKVVVGVLVILMGLSGCGVIQKLNPYIYQVKSSTFSRYDYGLSIGDALNNWFDGTEDWTSYEDDGNDYVEVIGYTSYTLTGEEELQRFVFEISPGKNYFTFVGAYNESNQAIGTTSNEWSNQFALDIYNDIFADYTGINTYEIMVRGAFGDQEVIELLKGKSDEEADAGEKDNVVTVNNVETEDEQKDANINEGIDYVSCYHPVIEQIADESPLYEYLEYAIYDMDNDGIMELLVDSGEEIFIYTMQNNEPLEIGREYVHYGTLFKAEDGYGIYIAVGRMGCETVYRLTKTENFANLYEEWSIGTGGLENYYENSHPILKYNIDDYSALENPPIVSSDPVTVDESMSYIFRTSSSQYLQESDLEGLDAFDCKIARNEIYARYGRLFIDAELQDYFDAKDWYIGFVSPEEFDESVLNNFERANLDLIVQYEIEQGYR